MLTKYAAAAILSAELIEQPAHAHDHRPWMAPAERIFKQAHRHAFVYDKRPGYLYVRSRAISSRCNDNYDEFPAEEIKLGYRTFIGKPVFVNHKNDDHRRARGVVIAAALHEDTNPDGSPDTWCEVLMEVDAVRFPKLAKAILAGEVDRTSMGTDVAYSKCSFCGNKASTPLDYCQHIPKLKGKRIRRRQANGSAEDVLVREICYGLSFFENSLLVEEPADPTAFFLGVEGDGVTATAGILTEAMLRAAGPKRAVRIPALGINEYLDIEIKPGDEARIEPMIPYLQYGPDYIRGLASALKDYSLFVSRNDLAAAEIYLAEAEATLARRMERKGSLAKEARICGEYDVSDYFPNECPSWQPYYYASWIKEDGKIMAVTGHDDAPGKQAGAFGRGWVRLMVTNYPTAPYLQAEIHQWPVASAQASAFSKLANELECRRSIIQVSEAAQGNGTYTIPTGQLSSFFNQAVPVGGSGAGSVSDFYERFSSVTAGAACPGTGQPASKAEGRDRCPVCDHTVYVSQGIFLRHEGRRDLGSDRAPGRPADWLSGFWAARTVCPGCGVGGSVEQAVAARGRCRCGTAIYLADERGDPMQALAMAPEWTQEDEAKHPRHNDGKFAPKGEGGTGPKGAPPPGSKAPGVPRERKLRNSKPPDQEYVPPFIPNPRKRYKDRKAEDYQPKKLSPEERAKHPVGSQENPIVTDDHQQAMEALWNGKWVELKRPEEVTLLADRLGKLKGWIKAQNARDKEEWVAQGGDPALYETKGFNLCHITVPGTNLFCEQTKDVPRIQMPQLKANNPLPGSKAEKMERDKRGEIDLNPMFKQMLQRIGIKVKDKDKDGKQLTRPVNKLKATQNELQGEKIGFFVDLLREKGPGAIEGSVFVSRDGYIVDGHHRWAGMLAYDLENGRAGDVDMAVDVIDADIIDILRMANDFCAYYGLPSQDAKTWAGYDPDAKKAASRRLAYGESKAPSDVDTLRDAECPVCGEEQSYDGETCLVCGFVKPPDMFMDPDLEKAQQVDLRQQEDDIGQPGGEQLSCDQCGAKFPKSPEAPGAPDPEAGAAGKPQPDPAEPHTHPGETHPDAQHGPEAHPDKPHPHDPEEAKKPAPGEKVDVEVDDGTDEDDAKDEDGKPKKKKPPFIKGSGKGYSYSGPCRYCGKPKETILRSNKALHPNLHRYEHIERHEDDKTPAGERCTQNPKREAAAVQDGKEDEPHLQTPSLPHVTDKDQKAEEAGKGEMPDTAPQAGDTCPECGKGTLRPDTPAATKQEEVPPGKDKKPDDGKKKDAPPWAKDDESKGKDQKESTRRNGVEMRPALAALAEQQQTIDHQARQIQALKQAVKGIARLAGVDEHPKFAALMKIADENNPVQPIPDPPSEAPAQTTEEALAPAGTDDPTTIGATPVTDVAADAVTDVLSTQVVLDEPLDLNEQNVQAPVAGTEGPRPLDEVKTETEIRVGDPNNPDTMFPLQGPFAEKATTGSREGRTIASMRLARLRIQAGIAQGDDLSMATTISGSNVSDEVIQAEIDTLSKVMRTAGRAPQGARNLVPRTASRQRSAPSLSESFAAPDIQVVSAVDDSEILFE